MLAISHIVFQIVLCHSDHRKQNKKAFKDFHSQYQASVSVIVPAYNEVPQILKNCIDSIVAQKIANLEVIVVDDGSKNRKELIEKVYDTYQSNQNVKILLPEKNRGKRHCQKLGFDIAKGDIIVTVDSDTLLHDEHAVEKLIQRFANKKVGAVTGDVRVENKNRNILTRLITYRYWSAFHQERAAQSRFHVVMCCSGHFQPIVKKSLRKSKKSTLHSISWAKIVLMGMTVI